MRISRETLERGDWLQLDRIRYADASGQHRTWEAASRRQDQQAVLIIPCLVPSGRYVLVQQYRPAVNAAMLEFPAGLCEPAESPVRTAERELLEETGYRLTRVQHVCEGWSSPALMGEKTWVVFAQVDEQAEENTAPHPKPDEGEHLTARYIVAEKAWEELNQLQEQGVELDNKVVCFFMGFRARG